MNWIVLFPFGVVLCIFLSKRIITVLCMAVFVAAFVQEGFSFDALRHAVRYFYHAAFEIEHLYVIVFTYLISHTVYLNQQRAVVSNTIELLQNKIKKTRDVKITTMLCGILIFFDDYASTMISGSVAKSLGQRLKNAREELAYIIDSTSAPVASLSIASTWIGYELSEIKRSMIAYGYTAEPMQLFISGLLYRYYPIIALVFVAYGCVWGVQYKRLRFHTEIVDTTDKSEEKIEGIKYSSLLRALFKMFLPISLMLCVLGYHMIFGTESFDGRSSFSHGTFIHPNFDSFKALVYASGLGVLSAFYFVLREKKSLRIAEVIQQMSQTFYRLVPLYTLLICAWSFSDALRDLHVGEHWAALWPVWLPVVFFPLLSFMLSAGMAFCIGSSWGTMALMFPVVVSMLHLHQLAPENHIFVASISSVLAGAVFGDHCSPVSDTTILSAGVVDCPVHLHVRTQMPYAMIAACVAIIAGYLPIALALPNMISWLSIFVSIGLLILLDRRVLSSRL